MAPSADHTGTGGCVACNALVEAGDQNIGAGVAVGGVHTGLGSIRAVFVSGGSPDAVVAGTVVAVVADAAADADWQTVALVPAGVVAVTAGLHAKIDIHRHVCSSLCLSC